MSYLHKLAIATLVAIATLKTSALPASGSMDCGRKNNLTGFSVPPGSTPSAVVARDLITPAGPSFPVSTPVPGTNLSSNDVTVIAVTIFAIVCFVSVLICSGHCSLSEAMRKRREARKNKSRRNADGGESGSGSSRGARPRRDGDARDVSAMSDTSTEAGVKSSRRNAVDRGGFEDVELGPMPTRPICSHWSDGPRSQPRDGHSHHTGRSGADRT